MTTTTPPDDAARWLRCRSCKALSHRDHARRCLAAVDHCVSCGSRDVEAVDLAAAHQARRAAASVGDAIP